MTSFATVNGEQAAMRERRRRFQSGNEEILDEKVFQKKMAKLN